MFELLSHAFFAQLHLSLYMRYLLSSFEEKLSENVHCYALMLDLVKTKRHKFSERLGKQCDTVKRRLMAEFLGGAILGSPGS